MFSERYHLYALHWRSQGVAIAHDKAEKKRDIYACSKTHKIFES